MGNLKWLIVGVLVLLGVYLLSSSQQSGYTTKTDRIFPEDTDQIAKMTFEANGQSLTLVKQDTTWSLVGHDTLVAKTGQITNLFSQGFAVSKETLMTQKSENWGKYSVDDSAGTHVKVYDGSDALVTHAVFGRSASDWSRNYVRLGDAPEVYLTNRSVLNMFNTTPTYWGEKPAPPAPAVLDSIGVSP